MIIGIIIAVVVVIAIITFASVSKDNQKLEETVTAVASNESALSNFTATKTIEGPLGTYKVCVDEANEKVAYISKEGTKVFSFEDMISVELLESGVTISKKSTARTLGGALVGGVLAGGAGMVVGGLSGSSRERRKVSSIIVKVTLRDVSNPSLNIVCFENYKLPPYSDEEGMYLFYGPAQEIVDTLTVIIDKVDARSPKTETSVNPTSNSLSDEIAKLHQMLKDGIITEEEFSKMKDKLIQ